MCGPLGNHISEVAGYLAERAAREGTSVAIEFNGEWLKADPPQGRFTTAVRAAAAVSWWHYDLGLARDERQRTRENALKDQVKELEAEIARLWSEVHRLTLPRVVPE